jgi:hypothetical protein
MITVDSWKGLVTNASPYSIPPGAAVTQVNLQVLTPGRLMCRPGTVAVSFTTHTAGAVPVIKIFRYPSATENIVYQNLSGKILVARGPS